MYPSILCTFGGHCRAQEHRWNGHYFQNHDCYMCILRKSVQGGRRLTWLESPVQFSGMSQSFTASLHTTPMNSICRVTQLRTASTQHWATAMWSATYLAIVATELIAALGALSQRALVTAGPSFSGALLKKTHSHPLSKLPLGPQIWPPTAKTHHRAATVTLFSLLH